MKIIDYTLSQCTLDQVFLQFAKGQREETPGMTAEELLKSAELSVCAKQENVYCFLVLKPSCCRRYECRRDQSSIFPNRSFFPSYWN